jgi:hypothetical protein
MPDGNYDIFIIPPHSAGSGFLYLPSLAVQRNSFLAGVACALLAVGMYTLVMPVLRSWLETVMASGGIGILLLLISVGVGAWAWGKTQGENNGGGAGGASAGARAGHTPDPGATPKPNYAPPPPPPRQEEKSSAQSGWEKAREETRKREEARKREEEGKRKREEAQKAREEAERTAKAKAEKEKWEQARAREKEQRERDARERIARERREKDTREREEREHKARSAHSSPNKPTQPSNYHKPTARSVEEEYSYRPYDAPPKRPGFKSSASSISGLSESSYAPSHSTARTTPPPSQRGPYSTKDPDKIQIKAVYLFSDSFPMKPIASLISSQGSVTDGLVLRIKTEGLFIDDDIRGVPQREWDVKAWTLKLVEDGMTKNQAGLGVHVLRATTRDAENKKYTFVLDETEAWKVAVGLARLRKGSQVRALGMNGMKESEVRGLLSHLGWM